MSDGVRTALMALLGLLVVIFGCLIAFAFVIRRQPRHLRGDNDDDELADQEVRDPMACPSCRREFDSHLKFCPHDATRLIPAPQMLLAISEQKSSGHICPHCRRTYDGPIRFCPHDGHDLVLIADFRAHGDSPRPHRHEDDPEHGSAKICPECRGRYRYGASFCGKDGVELVVLN